MGASVNERPTPRTFAFIKYRVETRRINSSGPGHWMILASLRRLNASDAVIAKQEAEGNLGYAWEYRIVEDDDTLVGEDGQ